MCQYARVQSDEQRIFRVLPHKMCMVLFLFFFLFSSSSFCSIIIIFDLPCTHIQSHGHTYTTHPYLFIPQFSLFQNCWICLCFHRFVRSHFFLKPRSNKANELSLLPLKSLLLFSLFNTFFFVFFDCLFLFSIVTLCFVWLRLP